MYDNTNFVDCNRLSIFDEPPRPRVITLRPGPSSSLKEITLIGAPRPQPSRPREITLIASDKYNSFIKVPEVDPLSYPTPATESLGSKKIPRPPNAFMIFANEWRKRLASQNPSESNKAISVRLGHLWKNMDKSSKEIYYQRSRQAGQDHKLKYPGYVYNPKEARMRKALREQSRGVRNPSVAPARWNKHVLTMNRQSLISPVLISQPHVTEDSKAMLHEQVEREHSMLQSYPDYVDIPYNVPSTDYALDTQNWYPSPYPQAGSQSNGAYLNRSGDSKLAVDWSTPYSSEQGNFIRASPQSSPYSMQNHSEVNSLMLNGDSHQEQTTAECDSSCLLEHKPVMDPIISQNGTSAPSVVKDPEQHVKELLASAKVILEDSPLVNGKQEDSGSMKLPGFHQAFGSTEIGRFSQPDGFFEAAVAAENERKSPGCTTLSFSPTTSPWTSSFFSCPDSSIQETDLFGFQDSEEQMFLTPDFNEPNRLYMMEDNFYDPNQQILLDEATMKTEPVSGSEEFQSQDLSAVASISKPPVIISQNDKCCVVLESSGMDNDVKEYFSL